MPAITETAPADPMTGSATHPSAMTAVLQRRYGDSSVLEVGEVPRPTIADDEVLIEVRAAAIDRGTEHVMTATPWLIRVAGFGLRRPKQPVIGLDVAGVVRAVGDDVTRFAVGDEVFGIARGSVAQYTAAKETKLSFKPRSISFEAAAASTVSGITALEALTDVGQMDAGQRVLIVGASGGVGTFAVQLAAALGATVDGIAGTANLELVASLGAQRVYDHRTTGLDDIDETYDLILDIGGRNPVRSLRRLLTGSGTLVFVGGENGNRLTGGIGRQIWAAMRSPFLHHRLAMFISTEHHRLIDRLAEHLGAGEIRPAIGGRYPLADGPEAMRQLESGRVGGKIVITVAGPAAGPVD